MAKKLLAAAFAVAAADRAFFLPASLAPVPAGANLALAPRGEASARTQLRKTPGPAAVSPALLAVLSAAAVGLLRRPLREKTLQPTVVTLAAAGQTEGDGDARVVTLSVTLHIKPECREAFLVAIRNNQRGTLNKALEPLALMYEYGEDPEKPNTWYFQERFKGDEGLRQHQGAAHFAAWEKFVQDYDPFSAPPEIKMFYLAESVAGTEPEPVVEKAD